MVGTITVSGFGATYTIRLSPGHKPLMLKTSHGNSDAMYEATRDALLQMRAENGGIIKSAVDTLRRRGYDVLLDGVDVTQTAEDIEAMDDADAHQLVVRDVSRALWRQVRSEAVKRGQPAGTLLNEILTGWLAQQSSR
jgi:hypothetical protein